MIRYAFILILVSLMASCSSGLKVYKQNENPSPEKVSLEYCLPKNKLDILFTVKKTHLIPGVFAKYAKEYLEISPKVDKENYHWEIVSVEHQLSSVRDTSNVYQITGKLDNISANNWLQINNLSKIGGSSFTVSRESSDWSHFPDFTELSLKKIMIEESKSSYKTVIVDSVPKRIPISNTVLRNKSEQEMAKDAAKTLMKIRKRKLRLIGAINEKFPESGDVRFMVEKLEQEEQKYLELFMGKTETVKEQFVISFIPEDYKSYRLFNFSETQGRVQERSPENSVILKLKAIDNSSDSDSENKHHQDLFPYRIPGVASLQISQGGALLYQTNVELSQFGRIQYLPINFLKDKNLKFDTVTGAIKEIK